MDRRGASAAKPGPKAQENKKPTKASAVASPGKGPATTTITLKAAHAAELKKVQAELDKQRAQSTKLEGVENKIRAVEEALRESRAHATLNEQKLQHTIQQKDQHLKQLAEVVDELKAEIDRCQTQLDADVKKETEEKKKALKKFEKVEKEVKELKQATAEAQMTAQVLREELEQTKADAEITSEALKEELKQTKAEAEMTEQALREELKQTKADAETTTQALREELKQTKSDAETTTRALKEEIITLQEEAVSSQRALKVETIVRRKFQDERDEIKRERDALEYEYRAQNAIIETGQNHIINYQFKKRDAELLIERLQDEAQKAEERILELEALVRGADMLATAREEQKFSPKPATPTTQVDLQNAASSVENKSDRDVKMTLEGTLECLRVQTEYILECHDDIFEETQRFRRALTRAPSNQDCAPLLVAS